MNGVGDAEVKGEECIGSLKQAGAISNDEAVAAVCDN